MNQTVVGLEDGQERVRLELTIAVGAEHPGDRIEIECGPTARARNPRRESRGTRATAGSW